MNQSQIYVLAMLGARAQTQIEVIRDVMISAAECARCAEGTSGGWLTLGEIAELTAFSEASVSAQLRNLRKPKFGAYVVEKRRRRYRGAGQWEYRMGDPVRAAVLHALRYATNCFGTSFRD